MVVVAEVEGGERVISGQDGAKGEDGKVEFKIIRVLANQVIINLPVASDTTESGLYYYKDEVVENDTVFKTHSGLNVGKFYANRIQHITFLKAGDLWIN